MNHIHTAMKDRGSLLAVNSVRSRKYHMEWYIVRDEVNGTVFLTNSELHPGSTHISTVSHFLLQRCWGLNNEEAAKLLEQYMDKLEATEMSEDEEVRQMRLRHFTRAIRETRAKKSEWVIRLSDGGDLHTVTESRYVRYCDRDKVVYTIADFLADGEEQGAELCDEAVAEILHEFIMNLDSMLEANPEA